MRETLSTIINDGVNDRYHNHSSLPIGSHSNISLCISQQVNCGNYSGNYKPSLTLLQASKYYISKNKFINESLNNNSLQKIVCLTTLKHAKIYFPLVSVLRRNVVKTCTCKTVQSCSLTNCPFRLFWEAVIVGIKNSNSEFLTPHDYFAFISLRQLADLPTWYFYISVPQASGVCEQEHTRSLRSQMTGNAQGLTNAKCTFAHKRHCISQYPIITPFFSQNSTISRSTFSRNQFTVPGTQERMLLCAKNLSAVGLSDVSWVIGL